MEMDIERRKIVLSEDVKKLGTYKANIKLHPEVEVDVDIEVVQD